METKEFDYKLPRELIAQEPVAPRDHSRLLVLERRTGKITHEKFFNIGKYLKKGDLLVLNDSKVIPARLWGRVIGERGKLGRKIEVLLLKERRTNTWQCLLGGKKRRVGLKLAFIKEGRGQLRAAIASRNRDRTWNLEFNKSDFDLKKAIYKYGEMPTPPYIKSQISNLKSQKNYYQTIYAKKEGSVAAPTAGFHFTKQLLEKLKKQGIEIAFVTLHIGLGTFLPIREEEVEKHKMHAEWFCLNRKDADRINQAKEEGRRVIAVGTTSVRVLETCAKRFLLPSPLSSKNFSLSPASGKTKLLIKPGCEFKIVDALITNFHLPCSTLLLLVSAFASRDLIFKAYAEAIRKKYRFYSFGDAMFII